MRRKLTTITRVLAAILALLMFASCRRGDIEPPDGDIDIVEPTPPEQTVLTTIPLAIPSGDGRFSLRYNKHATFNPLIGTDPDNMFASGLMYESLFVLDENFIPQNVLCESYETEDSKTYDFTFRDGILMSDGEPLSAYDIIYSLNMARNNPKYKYRLRNIDTVSAVGTRVVRVTLKTADARFPALLDIPIIKDGTAGLTPRGSGAYIFDEDIDGTPRLIKNMYYHNADTLPIGVIDLMSCTDAQLGERFTDSIIDIFVDNPSNPKTTVRRDHEIRYYNTTVLQFIGFNPRAAAIDNVKFRTAVALTVNRAAIVRDILDTRAVAAPLAFHPSYRLYDKTWEVENTGNLSEMLTELGLADTNSDTYLEFPVDGEMVPFAIDFIVSNENPTRVAAAKTVANALRHVGVNVILRELPYDDFKTALEDGAFDMYYGETRISAGFDFAPLIGTDGAVNYGNMTGYYKELSEFAAARGDFAERNAARALATKIRDEVPFIPIAYLQYAVHSGRNEITGITPSQSGIFWNIADWTIDVK